MRRPPARRRTCRPFSPGFQTLERRQLLAGFAFDPDGNGPLPALNLISMDTGLGQALVLPTPGSPAFTPNSWAAGNTFQVDFQLQVAGLNDVNGSAAFSPGLNRDYQITVVASVTLVISGTLTTPPPPGGQGSQLAFVQTAAHQSSDSFLEVYGSPTVDANISRGTGFNDGTLILSAKPDASSPGGFGVFNVLLDASGNPVVNPANGQGISSVKDTASVGIGGDVTYLNPAYFGTPITQVAFHTGDLVFSDFFGYGETPSALFVGRPGGLPPDVTPQLGAINGLSGPDAAFLTIGTISFFQAPRLATVSGSVYDDANNDGTKQAAEPGLAGATVTLSGTTAGRNVTKTTTTGRDGSYAFGQLDPGTYSVAETPPAGSLPGKDTAGSLGGVAGAGLITGIRVGSGVAGTGYDFGHDRPPVIPTTPVTDVHAVTPYTYDVGATDPDLDPLAYTLGSGPAAMQFDLRVPGRLTWAPTAADVGTHQIQVRVSDGRGGTTEEKFIVTVDGSPTYRPPHYTSVPVVDAYVGVPYAYPSAVANPDGDPLRFSLAAGPAGLIYDAAGKVAWTPTVQELGLGRVAIRVDDQHGGYDTQVYDVMVHPNDQANIHIISTPKTTYQFPAWANGQATIVSEATVRDVPMTFPDVQQNFGTGIYPGLVNPRLGLLQIAAGSPGLTLPAIADTGQKHVEGDPQDPFLSFTSKGMGWALNFSGGHDGSQLTSTGGGTGHTGANTATWQLTGLAPGDYLVQGTWHAEATLATNATYAITDGANTLATATVDQTAVPSGATYERVPFQNLAIVHVASGTLAVVLTDAANGPVAADAIRVVLAADLGWSSLTGPTSGAAGSAVTLQRSYTVAGEDLATGVTIAYYASPNAALGQGGDLLLGTEALAPSALAAGTHAGTSPALTLPIIGGAYHLFAVIDAAGAIHESDETNNIISATQPLTVSGPPVFPPTVVDDSGSGFSTTGTGWTAGGTGGYGGQVQTTGGGPGPGTGGTGANTATWQLTGLAPGDYQVAVTWTTAAGQATDAMYTLEDGSTPLRSVTVDQTRKPLGPPFGGGPGTTGAPFQTLATVHVASGTLDVVLTDRANGPVVADAIRVVAVPPVDLNWAGVSGPTVLTPGAPFSIKRDYAVTGEVPPADFTIAYYASTSPTPGGGADYLLGTEAITAAADKAVGNHDGTSPTLHLPVAGGTYYLFATINAGGSVIESNPTNDVGLVRGRTPTYSGKLYGDTAIIHGYQSFYDWYHDAPGVNQTELFPLVLTKDASKPNQYDFSSTAFFPVDGKLFGNDNPNFPEHNFNFMVEFHGSFTYHGGEQISLASDDDSWVFIDNQLVLDNGGMHGEAGGTALVDQLGLGLVIGQTYPIDIFYAERQTGAAALQVQTDL